MENSFLKLDLIVLWSWLFPGMALFASNCDEYLHGLGEHFILESN
jgi:hypothetical protein